jgi:hypothetical protein
MAPLMMVRMMPNARTFFFVWFMIGALAKPLKCLLALVCPEGHPREVFGGSKSAIGTTITRQV